MYHLSYRCARAVVEVKRRATCEAPRSLSELAAFIEPIAGLSHTCVEQTFDGFIEMQIHCAFRCDGIGIRNCFGDIPMAV